jgi:hypothetical protein
MRCACVAVLLSLASVSAQGGARIEVCFNYSCATRVSVAYDLGELDRLRDQLGRARDPASERAAIAAAVGDLYRIAGRQSPISADRAGNYLDRGVNGRMDCIDHSTTTTRLLELMQSREWLRFHRVMGPERRTRLIFQHFSAVIEEVGAHDARPAPSDADRVPDHVPVLLALCDCADVVEKPHTSDLDAGEPELAPGTRFVVDSWFVEHGEPAVILPLADWLKGDGPNVQ